MQTMKQKLIMALFITLLPFTVSAATFNDMQGKPVSIEDLTGQGKWSVFKIWASDCHVCQSTAHHIVDFEIANPDVNVYGISLDGVSGKANAQRFVDEHDIDFLTLLSNPSEIDQYLYTTAKESFIGTPTFMVFDPQGKLRALQPGAVTEEALTAYIQSQGKQ